MIQYEGAVQPHLQLPSRSLEVQPPLLPPSSPSQGGSNYEDVANGLSEKMQSAIENAPLKLDGIFKEVMDENAVFLDTFRIIASALCVLFIVLHVIKTFNEAAVDPQKTKSITPLYFLKMFSLVIGVCFYNQFFMVVEGWLVLLSDSKILNTETSWEIAFNALESLNILMIRDYLSLMAQNSTDYSFLGISLTGIGKSIAAAMAPNKWVYAFTALSSVAAFFNYLVSFVAYLDRTVILMLLNVLAPFAFSLTILDDYRKLASKYFMMIVSIMLVYPFILISFEVVDKVYLSVSSVFGIMQSTGAMDDMPKIAEIAAGGSAMAIDAIAGMMNYDVFLKFPLLIACIFLKLKFLSLIGQTLWKILI
jgi:hypothetical protein